MTGVITFHLYPPLTSRHAHGHALLCIEKFTLLYVDRVTRRSGASIVFFNNERVKSNRKNHKNHKTYIACAQKGFQKGNRINQSFNRAFVHRHHSFRDSCLLPSSFILHSSFFVINNKVCILRQFSSILLILSLLHYEYISASQAQAQALKVSTKRNPNPLPIAIMADNEKVTLVSVIRHTNHNSESTIRHTTGGGSGSIHTYSDLIIHHPYSHFVVIHCTTLRNM